MYLDIDAAYIIQEQYQGRVEAFKITLDLPLVFVPAELTEE